MIDSQPFEAELADRGSDEPALVVDVEGFEGPLDLLLTLARQQKVDLAKISVLALAEQYLAFIEGAQAAAGARRRLSGDGGVARLSEIAPAAAGDPGPGRAERRGHGQCAGLAAEAARGLPRGRQQADGRPQLNRDVFGRGDPEPIADIKHPQWTATLYDLLSAYSAQRQRSALGHVRLCRSATSGRWPRRAMRWSG
jgi:segregation and condensation protein A